MRSPGATSAYWPVAMRPHDREAIVLEWLPLLPAADPRTDEQRSHLHNRQRARAAPAGAYGTGCMALAVSCQTKPGSMLRVKRISSAGGQAATPSGCQRNNAAILMSEKRF